jgi:long-subunit acyl-CoA synthetase (AMP-forming)
MLSIYAALLRDAAEAPEKTAVSDDAASLTRRAFVARISGLAHALPESARVIGLLAPNGVDWAAAQLACAFAGTTLVPLPTFFSAAQLAHVVRNAAVDHVWSAESMLGRVAQAGLPVIPLRPRDEAREIACRDGFQQIIYTSGTTGQPKGVRHGARQIAWSTQALAKATAASEQDCYLSVLPLAMLLETICAVFIPALVGGNVHFAAALSEAVGRGAPSGLADVFDQVNPTACVLVPNLLRVWIGELARSGKRAPHRLRFVAVGGAPVPTATAEAAWRVGVPIYEGYGLSECCSVVTLNRIGERRPGVVGRPLDGLDVRIVNGEIVVDGPSVTSGYVGGVEHVGPWWTGDLGAIDEDGCLRVLGRKDNVIIASSGRNISPEWIETMFLADPRIAQCALVEDGDGALAVVFIPSLVGAEWFACASQDDVAELTRRACVEAPDYAMPARHIVVPLGEALAAQLLTANGRIRRKEAAAFARAKAKAPAANDA